jgi:zinc transport system substrate-binding protein
MVFHPSWGYFAHAYGLRQVAIEKEGKAPGPRHLEELIGFARKNKVRAIFIQPQFSRKSARIIARAIGARVLSADPLAEDWARNLQRVAKALGDTLDQP